MAAAGRPEVARDESVCVLRIDEGLSAACWRSSRSFTLFGLAEVYVVLWLLAGEPPSVLHAFILESAGRVINVLFRFVPLRVGVDENGSR